MMQTISGDVAALQRQLLRPSDARAGRQATVFTYLLIVTSFTRTKIISSRDQKPGNLKSRHGGVSHQLKAGGPTTKPTSSSRTVETDSSPAFRETGRRQMLRVQAPWFPSLSHTEVSDNNQSGAALKLMTNVPIPAATPEKRITEPLLMFFVAHAAGHKVKRVMIPVTVNIKPI